MNLRQAAQQALEALEERYVGALRDRAIEALEAALAEPEQEPVCDKDPGGCWNVRCQLGKVCKNTAPTPRKPLTEEEIWKCLPPDPDELAFARAIERAHGITGD